MFHSATSVSIKCLHLVLETDHWLIDFTRDCPQLNCWSIICLMILSNCCSSQLVNNVYSIMQVYLFCYYWIGASLQLGVQQLTELPEWTKHASTVHCTVQLYSTTIVLLSTAVQHNTIAQYYSTNTQYNTTARHYSTTVLIVPTLNTNLIT